jgi:3-hydroxyisobutyrate dehydrogenase-like beta-hydroxyacid dehydrogenase
MSVVPPGARIAFLGLGNLGQPMARALVRAGWSVTLLERQQHHQNLAQQSG